MWLERSIASQKFNCFMYLHADLQSRTFVADKLLKVEEYLSSIGDLRAHILTTLIESAAAVIDQ